MERETYDDKEIGCILRICRFHLQRIDAFKAQSIAAGRFTLFGIEGNGRAWGWGRNDHGQAGIGFASNAPFSPTRLAITAPIVTCATGTSHGLFLLANGTVLAAGSNAFGQLGNGTQIDSSAPVPVPGLTGVIAISAGDETSYALLANGTVWAWGRGDFGQIGDGNSQDRFSPVQTGAAVLTNVLAIDAGDHHCLALLANGNVWSWGWNSNGQLGDGTTNNANTPVQAAFAAPANVIAVSGGEQSSGALRANGSVWCWGDGGAGQMGNGTAVDSHVPTPSFAVANVVEIALGARHILARQVNGTLLAWGGNQNGALGNGLSSPSTTPVALALPTNVVQIAAGYASAARCMDGTVWLWGYGSEGQMGNASFASFNGTPMSPPSPYLGGPYLGSAGDSAIVGAGGAIIDILSINGSTGVVASNGLRTHRIDVMSGAPITISVAQPTAYPFPSPFVVYGFIGYPAVSDAVTLPFGYGTMAFMPYTLDPNYAGTFLLASSYGSDPAAVVQATLAPWSYSLPFGIPPGFSITFQALIWASFAVPVGKTNGVILNVT